LLPEEVAGVQSGALMLVEVTADGNGVDLLFEGEIDEAAEGVAELLAAVVFLVVLPGLRRRPSHAPARRGVPSPLPHRAL